MLTLLLLNFCDVLIIHLVLHKIYNIKLFPLVGDIDVAVEESGGGEAGEERPSEEPAAPAALPEAEQEQEEEERAEPRDGEGEGEGEWQQIAVPMLPPGVLAGMEVGKERLRGRERGGGDERDGPFEARAVLHIILA
jgi:hypothetical protein